MHERDYGCRSHYNNIMAFADNICNIVSVNLALSPFACCIPVDFRQSKPTYLRTFLYRGSLHFRSNEEKHHASVTLLEYNKFALGRWPFITSSWRLFQKLSSRGGGRRHFFVLWRKGVLLTTCPRGGGVNLSWGSRRIWSIVGLGCPEGRGGLTPGVSWGCRGLKKMRPTPPR